MELKAFIQSLPVSCLRQVPLLSKREATNVIEKFMEVGVPFTTDLLTRLPEEVKNQILDLSPIKTIALLPENLRLASLLKKNASGHNVLEATLIEQQHGIKSIINCLSFLSDEECHKLLWTSTGGGPLIGKIANSAAILIRPDSSYESPYALSVSAKNFDYWHSELGVKSKKYFFFHK